MGYLVYVFARVPGKGVLGKCEQVNFIIADSTHAGFITADEATRLLQKAKLYPVGRPMEKVNGLQIEATLEKNEFIEKASCYKSGNSTVNILIEQRLPLLRILTDDGENYYLDSKGKPMAPRGYVADLIVATGSISREFAKTKLTTLGHFLRTDDFWNSQVQQIHVNTKGEVSLMPRVGGHTIILGKVDNIDRKFRNLLAFYEKVMPQVGWNKYYEISVEHPTQIICRKADKKL